MLSSVHVIRTSNIISVFLLAFSLSCKIKHFFYKSKGKGNETRCALDSKVAAVVGKLTFIFQIEQVKQSAKYFHSSFFFFFFLKTPSEKYTNSPKLKVESSCQSSSISVLQFPVFFLFLYIYFSQKIYPFCNVEVNHCLHMLY